MDEQMQNAVMNLSGEAVRCCGGKPQTLGGIVTPPLSCCCAVGTGSTCWSLSPHL